MARAVYVTYFIALSIALTTAYPKECAVGPSYWCQSFQNAQDCGALRHCTDTVWRYDEDRQNVDSTTSCQWCQNIMENTHQGILNLADNEDAIKSTLTNACKLLPLTDVSLKCTSMMETYGTSVLSLMKHQRYNTLCHLMNICSTEETTQTTMVDEQGKMLCNVIVRATHELYTVQHKTSEEVQLFLGEDCQKLSDPELVSKCEDLIQRHGQDIYGHVASKVELSKICDYLGDATGRPMLTAQSSVHCDLCQVVLTHAKSMLGDQQGEDKVLSYIDEQVCSRLTGGAKKACQEMVLNNGKVLIEDIRSGNSLMLPCTHFQVCLDQVLTNKKSITKSEMKSFISKNFCDKLGSFAGACHALVDGDGTLMLQGLANNVNGNELCHMFGLCPKTTELLSDSNLKDDPSKCKRCVNDFTRRKHIAERLVNHSSEFLHHLCGQLPNESDCNKAIDESFNELLTFIRSMDPKDICIQLHMCDPNTVQVSTIIESDEVLEEEILQYMQSDLCPKLGVLSPLCLHIVKKDGASALKRISKTIDPHRVCEVLDVCPSNHVFDQCEDKCQCCMNKVDIYQLKFSKFLKTIVASTRTMCEFMPGHDVCVGFADLFESNVNKVLARLNSRNICQMLSLCPASPAISAEDQCQTCKTELKTRQKVFYTLVKDMTPGLLSSCTDDECHSSVRSAQSKTLEQIEQLDVNQVCQHVGYCTTSSSFEASPIQLRLRNLVRHQTLTLDQRLTAHDICSQYGSLSTMCGHILASPETHRYGHVYKALLKGDTKFVDDDLREQLQTKPGAAICDACKNAVQSGKDFWINSLDVIHNVMLQACERCPKKDECQTFYNQRFERMKTYINSIDQNLFCQSVHLCSADSKQVTHEMDQCTTCVAYFDDRKENLEQGVNRLIPYFKDLCQRYNLNQCDELLQGLQQSILPTIKHLQTKEICNQMGFCSLNKENAQISFDYYQKSIEDELEEKICSSLGPFESLCKQVLQGNHKQVQTVKINDNIRDLLHIGEDKKSVNLLSAVNQNECDKDKCQCCIDRIEGKKECLTNLANQVFDVLIKSCDYCPTKDQCQQYWKSEQDSCISSIKTIDSKQICTKMGFCNASSLCAKMNVFQDECERLLAQFTQSSSSSQDKPSVIEQHLPHTSVVILPSVEVEQINDSNVTCILCEYFMHILTNYIHKESTEKEIQESLEKICQQMPQSLNGQCREFVDNYAPVIVATLVQQFDPATVCRRLNLCTKQMKVDLPHLTKANSMACGVCDYVSTYVHFALKRDSSEKSLQSALKSVCTHLSSEQKSHCETLVQLFGPHMRNLQSSLGTNFCQQLTMCQTPMAELKPAVHRSDLSKSDVESSEELEHVDVKAIVNGNLDETPQCMLCRYVVTYLDAVLKTNKSEAAVEAALGRVCSILPKKDRPRCDEFVKTYGAVLADLIAEYADPGLVCRYLGMCQAMIKGEDATKDSNSITYSNHQYARIPV